MTDWLSDADWAWAQAHLPISCVDLLPVRIVQGRLAAVGLILRDTPAGPGWCLAGGRILRGESVAEAATRHLQTTLGHDLAFDGVDWEHPNDVAQYFTTRREGHPVDPRRHSVALTYAVAIRGTPRPTGEANEFQWFFVDELPTKFGFDQDLVVSRVIAGLEQG